MTREKYVETYGSKLVKQISEDFSVVIDVLKRVNESMGKDGLNDIVRYKNVAGLAADILVLPSKNLYLESRVKSLAPKILLSKN